MNHDADPAAPTIRRWRRIFIGLYIAFCTTTAVVILASILVVRFGSHPVSTQAKQIDPSGQNTKDLRRCHRDLARLLVDLHKETFDLQGRALRFDINPATEWQNWSRVWRLRWRTLNHRCRLSELSNSDASPEIGKMYKIHSALSELQWSYAGVMERFVDSHVDRLRALRRDLAVVRQMVDHRTNKSGKAAQTRSQ